MAELSTASPRSRVRSDAVHPAAAAQTEVTAHEVGRDVIAAVRVNPASGSVWLRILGAARSLLQNAGRRLFARHAEQLEAMGDHKPPSGAAARGAAGAPASQASGAHPTPPVALLPAFAALDAALPAAERAFLASSMPAAEAAQALREVARELQSLVDQIPSFKTALPSNMAPTRRRIDLVLEKARALARTAIPRPMSPEARDAFLEFAAAGARLEVWLTGSPSFTQTWLSSGCFDTMLQRRAPMPPEEAAQGPKAPRPRPGDRLTKAELRLAIRHHQHIDAVWATHRTLAQTVGFLALEADELPRFAGQRVLSVGEGAGSFMRDLERDYGADAVAVDRWYGWSMDKLREDLVLTAPNAGKWTILDPADLETLLPTKRVPANAEALPFGAQEFDAVMMTNLLLWFLDPTYPVDSPPSGGAASGWRILSEGLRVLRDDGELRFNMYTPEGAKLVAAEIRRRAHELSPERPLDVETIPGHPAVIITFAAEPSRSSASLA